MMKRFLYKAHHCWWPKPQQHLQQEFLSNKSQPWLPCWQNRKGTSYRRYDRNMISINNAHKRIFHYGKKRTLNHMPKVLINSHLFCTQNWIFAGRDFSKKIHNAARNFGSNTKNKGQDRRALRTITKPKLAANFRS